MPISDFHACFDSRAVSLGTPYGKNIFSSNLNAKQGVSNDKPWIIPACLRAIILVLICTMLP